MNFLFQQIGLYFFSHISKPLLHILMQIIHHVHYQSKVFGQPQKILFLILKVLFLMKQVKHHNVFIHYFRYKSSSVTLTLV